MKEKRDFVAEYHAHLETCERCAKNPMMPCTLGGWLLQRAATSDAEPIK